jgi:hypothetical protein
MFENIYYLFGTIIILRLIYYIINFKKLYAIREWLDKYNVISETLPKKNDFRTELEKSMFDSNSVMLLYEVIWFVLGFLTVNKIIFLYMLFYFIFLKIISKKIKFTIIDKIVIFSNTIIRLIIYSILIINHFI